MKKRLMKLWITLSDKNGQTMAECGLMILLAAIVVIMAIALLEKNPGTLFNNIAGRLKPTSSAA